MRTLAGSKTWYEWPTDSIPVKLADAWDGLESQRRVPLWSIAQARGLIDSGSRPASVARSISTPSLISGRCRSPDEEMFGNGDNSSEPGLMRSTTSSFHTTVGSSFSTHLANAQTLRRISYAPKPLQLSAAPALCAPQAAGRLAISDDFTYFEWAIPRNIIEVRNFAEELAADRSPPLNSPYFDVHGEPCCLKLWKRGRKSYMGVGQHETAFTYKGCGRSWISVGFFPKKPGVHLHVCINIGPRDKPWVTSGPREVYSDTHHIRPEQFLDAMGRRPFKWDELQDDILHIGVHILRNCREPPLAHKRIGKLHDKIKKVTCKDQN